MGQFCITVRFQDRRDYDRLKVAAIVEGVSISGLIDRMVDDELKRFTKQEADARLQNHTKRERLLAAW